MNMTAFIDVAIGLFTVYIGASLFVTVMNEYLAQALNGRGRRLGKSISKPLQRPGIAYSPFLKPLVIY